ncbi:hypothetical protein HLB23_12020 [Nocardia uniformis]|uniref:Uncharacterized protein n=1 Tax=Nocardia uniformis TaxID=53432 RepID=A0A849C6S2_9NOCA|nr:hypothetical protein [Nocardia uniformis]NNH70579.1 hypothetical protein [Nocardia uniformis]
MTATSPPRGVSARLLAVLAALAGIALVHGLQCEDGMPVPVSMSHSMTHSVETVGAADGPMDHLVTGALDAVENVIGAPMTLGGLLAACLVAILAWWSASALRMPRPIAAVACPIRAGPRRATRTALPRAPTLAQLCVLRT